MSNNMSKAITPAASADSLAQLGAMSPQDASYKRAIIPRLNFKSQDVMEGKGKNKTVVMEAGTFVIETQTDEINEETGKPVWSKDEQGLEIPEAHIIFQRKQLSYYDEVAQEYISSPVYDTNEDVVPLFKNKKKIAEGLPKDLKALYQYKDKEDKVRSNLEDNRILYVLIKGEMHQLSLRGSSMYSFLGFAKQNQYNGVIVKLGSTSEEKGSIEWNQMSFKTVRAVNQEEVDNVITLIQEIKDGIEEEKEFYASQQMGDASAVTTTDEKALPSGDF